MPALMLFHSPTQCAKQFQLREYPGLDVSIRNCVNNCVRLIAERNNQELDFIMIRYIEAITTQVHTTRS